MGRKKKKVEKPWCWYCNREFDDDKILIQHQKAKHFKCHICHKKLFSGPGLSIHCMQVHKETIDKIPAAVNGRDNIHVEIYGMQGIPAGAYRGVSTGDDEPDEKRSRIDAPPMPSSVPFPPHFPFPGMPPMPPGAPPPGAHYGMPPMPPGPFPPHGMPGAYPPPQHAPFPPAPAPGVYMPPPGMPGAYPPPRSSLGLGPPMPPMGGPGGPGPGSISRSRFDQNDESRWGAGPPRGGGGQPRTPPYENGHDSHGYGSGRGDSGYHQGGGGAYDDHYRERDGPGRYDHGKETEATPHAPAPTNSAAVAAAAAVASKLGSRTRIVHPDDHSLSLEERRVKILYDSKRQYH